MVTLSISIYHGRFLERCLCIESGIEVRAFVEMSADSGGPKKIFRAQANLTTDNKFTYSYTNGLYPATDMVAHATGFERIWRQ